MNTTICDERPWYRNRKIHLHTRKERHSSGLESYLSFFQGYNSLWLKKSDNVKAGDNNRVVLMKTGVYIFVSVKCVRIITVIFTANPKATVEKYSFTKRDFSLRVFCNQCRPFQCVLLLVLPYKRCLFSWGIVSLFIRKLLRRLFPRGYLCTENK